MVLFLGLPNAHTATSSAGGSDSLLICVGFVRLLLSRVLSAAQKHGGRAAKFVGVWSGSLPEGSRRPWTTPMSPMGRALRNFRPSIPGSLTAAKGQSPAAKVG